MQEREGRESYEKWRKELISTPEGKEIYEEEAAKKDLWLQLVEARMDLGLSSDDIAKKMGTSKSVITSIERNAYHYKLSTLRRYVKALGEDFELQVIIKHPQEIKTSNSI